ncbi:MAG TPA: sugar porter family MFS transporter [Chloroflexota bacterium]|nr:sugar porter family MFS transporter [Chloroflexota bacterium]
MNTDRDADRAGSNVNGSQAPKPASQQPTGRFVYVAAIFAALGGLLFGYDTGVISGAILFVKDQFSLSSGTESEVVSSVLWGAVVGALFGGWLADRFGRRPVILGAAVTFVIGAIGTALTPTVSWLIGGRVVVGIAIGVASLIAPMYIAEIAPPAIRGTLVSINQLALVSGILVAYLIDYALAGAEAWRWMFALAAFPAAVLAIGMLFLPESPRWLIAHDHLAQGRQVLTRIRAGKTAETEREIADIRSGLALQGRGWDELRHPGVRPALLVGVLLALFQQLTGINTVIYYAPTIFQYAGITSSSAAILATVGVGVINVLTTIVAVRLIDRTGRRPLLLVSLVGMTVSLVALGLAFRSPSTGGAVGWFAAASLAVYIASFAVGLGPVFWLLISEIYPLSVRGVGMSLATVVNWVTNLLVALTFLTLIDHLGKPGTFWLYASISVVAVIFSTLFIPETKGKSLEEIEAHWHGGGRLRELGQHTDAD